MADQNPKTPEPGPKPDGAPTAPQAAAAQPASGEAARAPSEPAPAASAGAPAAATATSPAPYEPQAFDKTSKEEPPKGIDLLSDVNLNVKIELGRTRMLVEDVLKLSEGAVVELDKLAGDPVDVYVNERHIARGEVLVLNDNFCVRINEILADNSDVEAVKR
jgi:flagellar motor switch protein FliN